MENEILTLMRTRRSVRAYRPEQIAPEELDAVLQAGTWAASGMNRQTPVLVAVQNAADRAQLTRMNAAFWSRDIDTYFSAPTIVLALADPAVNTWVEDGSLCLGNMMLAAHALGLGACWVHRERQMFAAPEGKALLKKWGLPETLEGVGAIALGYPDGPLPDPKPRREGRIVKV